MASTKKKKTCGRPFIGGTKCVKEPGHDRACSTRLPYDADHVHIVHEPGSITALYIYDPEKAKDPKATLNAPGFESGDEYMVIAEASRFYKSWGADFSGWIVSTPLDGNYSSEAIPNRKEALKNVWDEVRSHFNR
ncbi:hypothetical protein [Nocardiopsis synnemataformans]|uniref:hypothetical protein n=1 Tax=Nocardiopsis synnemataformans TaxID=61305 RepID=UPI003EB8D77A